MSKGLVLEGGGMRGIFTAGVLDFFLENDISFDSCIGVSAGACHAASYLCGQKGRARRVATEYLNDKRYCSVQSLLTTGDLFGEEFVYHELPEQLDKIDAGFFRQNPCRFQAAVTNCISGEAEYPDINDIIADVDIIRASSSLPFLARMVDIGGKPYLDGGIADAIPVRRLQEQGCEKIVVVLTRERTYRKKEDILINAMSSRYKDYPKLVEKLKARHEIYNATLEYIAAEEAKGNIFVIAPSAPIAVGRLEKDKGKMLAAAQAGYECAQESYERLKQFLICQKAVI